MKAKCLLRTAAALVACTVLVLAAGYDGAAPVPSCQKVTLQGEVKAGQEWKAAFGQGWVFRVVPIASGYSGWDLVVDREQPAGFPDALLLATPPYNSINEHEVGTTFGLRAQDAIGWNPRSFRFLVDPATFHESQRLFQALGGAMQVGPPAANSREGLAIERLLKNNQKSAAGQFRILDVRLAPGNSDAASYAENWALASQRTPHTFEPVTNGDPSPLGELHWMKFPSRFGFPLPGSRHVNFMPRRRRVQSKRGEGRERGIETNFRSVGAGAADCENGK